MTDKEKNMAVNNIGIDEYMDILGDTAQLDGYFRADDLRKIANIMDENTADYRALVHELAEALDRCLIDSAYRSAIECEFSGDVAYQRKVQAETALSNARKAGIIK